MAIYKDPRALAQSLAGAHIDPQVIGGKTSKQAQQIANFKGEPVGALGTPNEEVKLPAQWKYVKWTEPNLPEDWDDYSTDDRLAYYESKYPNGENKQFYADILNDYKKRMAEFLKEQGIAPKGV